MTILGDPDLWADIFPERLIPEVLTLIVEAWDSFNKPAHNEPEVHITRRFRQSLIAKKSLNRLPLRIERESVEDDLQRGVELGRIDLRFTAAESAREDVYLAIECKKLSTGNAAKRSTLADRYVTKGMMRFITHKYSMSQLHGGMIGYIMDGELDRAIGDVGQEIKRKRERLKANGAGSLQASSFRPDLNNIRETWHSLAKGEFCIHHILLTC